MSRARVGICDDALDDFASRFAKAILIITKDNRNHALWTHHFGKKTLGAFRRPILAGQLAAMEQWIPSLKESVLPSLKDMESELVNLVAAAKKAVADRNACREAIKHFNNVGERKELIDQLNGARKKTHGKLSQLAHETIGLPADFANRFFSSEAERQAEEPETIAALEAHIAELKQTLSSAEARLAALEAEQALEEAKKAETEAALAAIAEEEAALAKKKAALLSQLET